MFAPDLAGGAAVHSDLCVRLAELGHEVEVHTAYPYYPEWRNKSDANLWRRRTELFNNVHVVRHGLFLPNDPSRGVARLVLEVSFFLSLLRSLYRGRAPQVVIATYPLFSTITYAAVVAIFRGAPLWIYVQDIMSEAAMAAGLFKSSRTGHIMQFVEGLIFRQAQWISTIAPKMVERLERRLDHRVYLLPNWLNRSMKSAIDSLGAKKPRLPRHPLRLLYAGNIGKKQGLHLLCEKLAASKLAFEMRIFGNGADKPSLERWHAQVRDARFMIADILPESGFVKELHDTDFFLISETPDVGASFIPSKLIPCISTGTPVLAICEHSGPLGEEVATHQVGKAWAWSDIDACLAWLATQPQLSADYISLSRNCLRRANDFQGETAVRKLLGWIRRPKS